MGPCYADRVELRPLWAIMCCVWALPVRATVRVPAPEEPTSAAGLGVGGGCQGHVLRTYRMWSVCGPPSNVWALPRASWLHGKG